MRRFLRHGVAAVAALFAIGGAAPGRAALFVLDVTGFASGSDVNDLFGLGTTLVDVPFSERFTIDDAAPGARPFDAPGTTGIVNNYSAPAVTASFTINGRSIAFGGPGSDTTAAYKESGAAASTYTAVDVDSTSMIGFVVNSLSFTSADPAFRASPDYRSPFAIGIADGAGGGTVRYGFVDALPDYFGPAVLLDLRPATARLAAVAAVPESSTWMLMTGGFALVAGAARRGRGRRVSRCGAR